MIEKDWKVGAVPFIKEALYQMELHGKDPKDVEWVGSRDGKYSLTWEEFAAEFSHVIYDAGYGGHEIHLALVIVGSNWWMERAEYDGSEWWEFKTLPHLQPNAQPFTSVGRGALGKEWE